MARRWSVVIGVVACVLAFAGAGAAADKTVRPVRLLQDVPELGLSVGLRIEGDGAVGVTATAGDLAVSKRVYADGRFVVRLATRGDDRVIISGTPHELKVAYGPEAAVDLRDDSDADGKARRV